MNKIFKSLTTANPLKVKIKRQVETLAFNKNGECLGKIVGNDSELAFKTYPNAEFLNVLQTNGRTKIVNK